MTLYISGGKLADPNALRNCADGWYKLGSANVRSLKQNDYYWQMCDTVKVGLRDLGWDWIKTKEDAHNYLRERFLRRVYENKLTGDTFMRTLSTTELTTTEMNEYWEEIWKFAAEELGIVIKEPHQRDFF